VNENHLRQQVEWNGSQSIFDWLRSNGFQVAGDYNKPARPKEAFLALLKQQNIPKSSSLYASLTKRASYKRCVDLSFRKFIETVKNWFS
jgi:hypothetical protein